jgi:hypothetical protein
MLVKNSVNTIVTLKLNSGEEMLGRVSAEDANTITLDRVLMVGMTQKGPAFAPALMTVDPEKSLTFSRSSICIIAESDREIAEQYVFQTTGIQPVSAGSIITR